MLPISFTLYCGIIVITPHAQSRYSIFSGFSSTHRHKSMVGESYHRLVVQGWDSMLSNRPDSQGVNYCTVAMAFRARGAERSGIATWIGQVRVYFEFPIRRRGKKVSAIPSLKIHPHLAVNNRPFVRYISLSSHFLPAGYVSHKLYSPYR
jgi:hypothetical protein